MSKLKQLEKAIGLAKIYDATSDDHKLIYLDHMDPQGVPQISALVYGASRILLPHVHWDSIPELLDVFALAESIRQQTVADAGEALVWDQFYRQANGGTADMDGHPLTDEERKTLKAIAKKSSGEAFRERYTNVIMQVCWAHIHRLRRSDETFLIPLFFRRYFPPIRQLQAQEEQCPQWLRGMSDAELNTYGVFRERIMVFLEDAEQWEQEYYLEHHLPSPAKLDRTSPEYQSRFWERFPLTVGWDALAAFLQRHMTKIQNMVTKLHSIFPDDPLPDEIDETGSQNNHSDVMVQRQDTRKTARSSPLSYVDVSQNVPGIP